MSRSSTHRPDFHRRAPVKEPVRVATTGNVTISTALNNGDTIDGVVLSTGDRVLVWQQSVPSENGIYEVAATPVRAYDMDAEDEVAGAIVGVLDGTTYGAAIFHNTNVGSVLFGATSITFDAVTTSDVGASEGGMVPYFIASGETFTVPEFKQALFAITIDNEGTLDVDGYLVEVN